MRTATITTPTTHHPLDAVRFLLLDGTSTLLDRLIEGRQPLWAANILLSTTHTAAQLAAELDRGTDLADLARIAHES